MRRFALRRTRSSRWLRAAPLSLALVCVGTVAHATESDGVRAPKAADLRIAADRFDEGRAAFKSGAFAEAAEHFEAADARAPSSSALALAMRSRSEAGQHAKAATLAEVFIVRHADNAELVEQAKAIIDSHVAELARLEIECSPRCELIVDQKLVHGQAMASWRVHVEPGTHEIVANFDGDREAVAKADATMGQSVAISLQAPTIVVAPPPPLPVTILPPPPPPKAKFTLPPTVFWVGVGVTGILGVATAWSGIDTLNNPGSDAVREACASPKSQYCNTLYDKGQAKEVRTNVLLAGTLVVAAATAITGMFATDFGKAGGKAQRGAPNWSFRPIAGLGQGRGALFGAEGRF